MLKSTADPLVSKIGEQAPQEICRYGGWEPF